ncbi:Pr6Pr family membrane protein [Pedobacter rhizosphaerae]|uniref:FAR-17a/AIG1-like protein n=1 Tax=Pedobacter rhizosphaerae TaxID=390241 RepID=A0A1H9TBL1_9SPHI|nr:Pr6Pr family membrane protein [Pedobacter rhizosphaerae]SER94334.1 hypothetical protein SAMN04488023_12172 [Pedobacter rhizosphaerae]
MKSAFSYKLFTGILFFIFWFGIILQFVLILEDRQYNWLQSIDGFLMYFTVLTNIICGLALGSVLFYLNSKSGNFLTKSSWLTAITVYIVVVGLIYNLVLRGIVNLTGLSVLANELLHVVNPILFLIFWMAFVDKSTLKYSQIYAWLVYPFLYMVFALVRGALVNTYPYPFLNVSKLGYAGTALNCLGLSAVFGLGSLLFVWAGKQIASKK